MIKYVVVPRDHNTPYDLPTAGDAVIYHVQNRDDRTTTLQIEVHIRLQVPWAENGIIRIEGFTRTIHGSCGVTGLYRPHSVDSVLGILEVQDA